jgi:hypothetical protein
VHKQTINKPQHIGTPGYTTTVNSPEITAHVVYLGHHWILLAAPAFLPAVTVVSVVLYIAIRDRRARTPDDPKQPTDTAREKDD